MVNLELQFLNGSEPPLPHAQCLICAGGERLAEAPFWATTLEG